MMHNLTENPILESTGINLPHERSQLGWNKERVDKSAKPRVSICGGGSHRKTLQTINDTKDE